MDASNFCVKFCPVNSGLIRTIESQLVPTQAKNEVSIESQLTESQLIESQLIPTQAKKEMSLKAEMYKLNVYGEPDPPVIDECRPL